MELIIALIILIIGLIVYGMFSRKQIYKEVDRLEAYRMELANMPVAEEISKVKELNMTGQTEEMFERWREQWDEIVAVQLPKVDELLFETEEATDKYRFKKAKQLATQIDTTLLQIKANIDEILNELQSLIGSEQDNRHDIEALQQSYRQVKKKLLSHRYSYGKAEKSLEQAIEELKDRFTLFEEETDNGNYLQAREVVLSIQRDLHTIDTYLDEIPKVFIECQTSIPTQLDELFEGYQEMVQQGYVLEHLQIEESIEALRVSIAEIIRAIENLQVVEATTKLDEVNAKLESMYDSLEHEVMAYHTINREVHVIMTSLRALQEKNKELREETTFVQHSYQVNEADLDIYYKMERELKRLTNFYYNISDKIAEHNIAYSVIQEELEEVAKQLEKLKETQHAYVEMLQALRKDEIIAKEKINELKLQLQETKKIIQKGNLPGLPQEYKAQVEKAKKRLEEVTVKLHEKPLSIRGVNELLEAAIDDVQATFMATEDMVEEAFLVERVIQYGNRYRSSYSTVAQSLQQAEEAFRKYEYKEALSQASAAIEQVEPGAVERIQKLVAADK
ncbi:septation ring formation regulator EzrA [Metabacillus iocasae]|uniref:Septation ring formation regulator EzrA n=1 Tax=Priestia iocasae TaxID=2291674 RepID=A0ABS2QPF2_9BACI|nr:septation ring formation regulator EzrA [Metabacillus iocasae]MBM7701198.1 septation ring formation regulator [Metabacillus iocasae]